MTNKHEPNYDNTPSRASREFNRQFNMHKQAILNNQPNNFSLGHLPLDIIEQIDREIYQVPDMNDFIYERDRDADFQQMTNDYSIFIWKDGDKYSRKYDLPAVIYTYNGDNPFVILQWWVNDVQHREHDKPASVFYHLSMDTRTNIYPHVYEWWKNGNRFRKDKPSIQQYISKDVVGMDLYLTGTVTIEWAYRGRHKPNYITYNANGSIRNSMNYQFAYDQSEYDVKYMSEELPTIAKAISEAYGFNIYDQKYRSLTYYGLF